MQKKQDRLIKAVNANKIWNILTAATHERTQSNLYQLPHTFYLYNYPDFKPWNQKYAKMPRNHIMLESSPHQIRPDMKFDVVWSQNRFGQIQVLGELARQMHVPHVNLEHTWAPDLWTEKKFKVFTSHHADVYVFITEASCKWWGFDQTKNNVHVLHHGIDTDTFKPSEKRIPDGKVLVVANDYKNRNYFLGYDIFERVAGGLPIQMLGDNPGISVSCNDINELVGKFQNASVFLNTSTRSPIPHSLLEAASVGLPIITTETCGIPELIKDGYNGFMSNDEKYLRSKLEWCLANPDKTQELGNNARKSILEKYTLEKHLKKWSEIFEQASQL